MTQKPKIVIIGAGMAGLVAANKLYKASGTKGLFELCVIEAGNRIGGRICSSDFGESQVELGATWIHGIHGSPIHEIAKEIGALESEKPWEHMKGYSEDPLTIAEGGFKVDQSIVAPISKLHKQMMDYSRGKLIEECEGNNREVDYCRIAAEVSSGSFRPISIGSYLRHGLEDYWSRGNEGEELDWNGRWSWRSLEEAIFRMHDNNERTHTGAGDLFSLDFNAEHEYQELPDEEITIAQGYSSIIEYLASGLPAGLICLDRKVARIDWCPEIVGYLDSGTRPVKLHFEDGSTMEADHVIVTVSLGVLKAGIDKEPGMFNPPLPSFKTRAISRLGFGVVNKLFLQVDTTYDEQNAGHPVFPFLQMVFHQPGSESIDKKIPWWMRRTASIHPIHKNSNILLTWFAGQEAIELESLKDDEIVDGVAKTISSFLSQLDNSGLVDRYKFKNGSVNSVKNSHPFKPAKILKSGWGTDPLFMGSYSYVAVGSSGEDFDRMALPLPSTIKDGSVPPLQILFAGEATDREQYSSTHGAYFSGVREANRLLQYYKCNVY
ncbi:hypothetical protein Syun_011738 [Stephania yunnanensis]|uniref:Amine oxidase domain-containing protein n=1 Tax=Stephania yunnanensis TaxID=152371 RepID=A0AAP0JZB7_9MAGN